MKMVMKIDRKVETNSDGDRQKEENGSITERRMGKRMEQKKEDG